MQRAVRVSPRNRVNGSWYCNILVREFRHSNTPFLQRLRCGLVRSSPSLLARIREGNVTARGPPPPRVRRTSAFAVRMKASECDGHRPPLHWPSRRRGSAALAFGTIPADAGGVRQNAWSRLRLLARASEWSIGSQMKRRGPLDKRRQAAALQNLPAPRLRPVNAKRRGVRNASSALARQQAWPPHWKNFVPHSCPHL